MTTFDLIEKIIVMIASGLIGGFIGYFFGNKIEEYKFYIYQRQQAEKIAELFAKWIKYDGKTEEFLNDKKQKDYYEQLNKLTWELAMWVPDEKLVKQIMTRLSNTKNAKNIKEIILEVRELILHKKSNELKWEDLVHFSNKK